MKANSGLSVLAVALFSVPGVTLAQAPANPGATSAPPATQAASSTPTSQPANAATALPPTSAANQPASAAAAPSSTSAATLNDTSSTTAPGQSASRLTTDGPASDSAGAPASAQAVVTGPRAIAVSARPEAASPPRPLKLRYPLSVQLDVMPVWQTSHGYDLFSTDDIATRIGLSAGYDVLDVAPKTPLGLELGWSTESHGADELFPSLKTALSAHNFHGGLKLRHQLLPYLAPYASLLAGAARMKTTFEAASPDRTRTFETVKWAPFAMLGVGLAAMLPVDNRVAFGASAELGYVLSGSMPLRFDPKDASGALPGAYASMGELGRSGPYLRFGFFVRY